MSLVSIKISYQKSISSSPRKTTCPRKEYSEIFNGTAEVIMAIDEDDEETYKILNNFPQFRPHVNKSLEIPAIKWNNAVRDHPDAKWFVTMSDDSLPHPEWLSNALKMISKGFIGLPDGVTGKRNESFTPLYMATKEWLKKYNGGVLVIPKYKSWYADIETSARAHRSGTYMVGNYSVVEQLHEVFGTAPKDEMYELGATRRIDDYKMYEDRLANGFPNDFESVL